jgi:hypothetical protein
MPSIGSVWWTAEIRKAEDAADKADRLQRELDQTAEKARESNRALRRSGAAAGEADSRFGRLRNQTGRLGGSLGILTSAVFFLGTSIASLLGVSTSLGAAWATVTGVVTTASGAVTALGAYLSGGFTTAIQGAVSAGGKFLSWLAAGSAGALAVAGAIGAVVGVAGVFILEITGALDAARRFGNYIGSGLSPALRDLFINFVGFVAGPLAVAGSAISGFVSGYLDGGLSEGIDRAVSNAQQTLGIFEGAWNRTLARVSQAAQSFSQDIGQAVGGSIRRGWNAVIPSSVTIPSVSVAGQTFGGQSVNLPQLNTGGLIERAGAAFLHEGEAVVPADVTRNVQQTVSGSGGDSGLTIESVSVEVGDQTLDLSTLTRSELDDLASRIADEFGTEIESIIS